MTYYYIGANNGSSFEEFVELERQVTGATNNEEEGSPMEMDFKIQLQETDSAPNYVQGILNLV